jgi:hypothetical protein
MEQDNNQNNNQENQSQSDQNQGSQNQNSQKSFDRVIIEEFKVSGDAVVAKVKELVREGNVRRIIIKNEEGKVLIEIPLAFGVIGTLLLPVWAGIGAIAALVANLTITVERPAKAGQENGQNGAGNNTQNNAQNSSQDGGQDMLRTDEPS